MRRRWWQYRRVVRERLGRYERGIHVLGATSVVVLVAVALSGGWLLATLEPDPVWFGYRPDTNFAVQSTPRGGVALAHRFSGDLAGVVALAGGGWFMWRIGHALPWPAIVAFVLVLVALITQSMVRFNVIKIEGRTLEESGDGYLQLLTEDVEYVVSDTGQYGRWVFVALVVGHLTTLPIIVAFAWASIRRGLDRMEHELDHPVERTWHKLLRRP